MESNMGRLHIPAIPEQDSLAHLRVLLVDDSAESLVLAVRLLTTDIRVDIVGYAFSGNEALEQVPRLRPHLVVIASPLPDMDGLEAVHQIKAQPDAPCVIILTTDDAPGYGAAAEVVNADGCITKSECDVQLLPLVQTLFGEPDVGYWVGGSKR
jgi:CheY-like chemotaxis protein